MNAHGLDSETADRLLDGAAAVPRDGRHPLAPLLSAVRAAPCPGELAGEAAAVRAYRMARLGEPLTVPGVRRRGFTLTGFGARAALAGLLVAGTGGVALAAGGVVPNPLRPPVPPPGPSAPAVAPGGSPTADPRSTPPADATGRPEPGASGLCRAYRTRSGDSPGRALDTPAFARLVDAAGGPDQVPGYCDQVLATEPGTADPTAPGRPGNRPDVRPTGRSKQPATPTRRSAGPGGPGPGTQADPERPTARSGGNG